MKFNAATLSAAKGLGLNSSQLEAFVNGDAQMSEETANNCASCIKLGRMQGDMTDEEYNRYSEQTFEG